MSSTQISELIANKQGQIYKDCATLRLFRTWTKKRRIHNSKEIKKLYSITPKGKKLLKGWMSFLEAFD